MIKRLFVPGLPRCATTSFVNVLSQHPEIMVGFQKEPHDLLSNETLYSFTKDGRKTPLSNLGFAKSYKENISVKPEKDCYYLDASTLYSVHSSACKQLVDIGKSEPIKIIVFFKKSLPRALSHYTYLVSRGEEHRSFEQALNEELEGLNSGWLIGGYMKGGDLRFMYNNCLQNLGKESYLLVNIDEVKIFSSTFMKRICCFLEISEYEFNFDVYENKTKRFRFDFLNDFRIFLRKTRQISPKLVDNKLTRMLFNIFMMLGKDTNNTELVNNITDKHEQKFSEIDNNNLEILARVTNNETINRK